MRNYIYNREETINIEPLRPKDQPVEEQKMEIKYENIK